MLLAGGDPRVVALGKYINDSQNAIIDLFAAQIYDSPTVAALDSISVASSAPVTNDPERRRDRFERSATEH